jgi:hypothetical protein
MSPFLTSNHNRPNAFIETITRMDLELCQIAALLDEGELCGEQLDKVIAQIAGIECQKVHIIGLLRRYTVEAGSQLD